MISSWTSDSNLVSINSQLDCGAYYFVWKQRKDGGSLEDIDTALFTIGDNRIITVQATDENLKGEYVISYEVTQAANSLSATQPKAFTYQVIDPCSLATVTVPVQ